MLHNDNDCDDDDDNDNDNDKDNDNDNDIVKYGILFLPRLHGARLWSVCQDLCLCVCCHLKFVYHQQGH